MTHLPFIAAAYGLTVAAGIGLALQSVRRLRRAQSRLAAAESRK